MTDKITEERLADVFVADHATTCKPDLQVRAIAWLGTNLDGESEPFLSQYQAEFWSNGASKVEPLITLSSHQSVIAAKDAEIERLRKQLTDWQNGCSKSIAAHAETLDKLEAAEARANAAVEALTPSADTKAAYIGEFYMGVTLSANGEEEYRRVQIPWDSIKQIMAAIKDRATLNGAKP